MRMRRLKIFEITTIILLLISVISCQHLRKKCDENFPRRDCGDDLICNHGMCTYCETHAQCNAIYAFNMYACKDFKRVVETGQTLNVKLCKHKDLFTPYISPWDIIAFIIIFIVGAFAASGGIGGGGVFVPLLSIFTQFGAGYTIPISKAMIMGSALFNYIVHVFRGHPVLKERPLIDYEVSVLMEPPILLGTIVGVLLNLIFPEWLIVVLMVFVLVYTGYKTVIKGYKAMKREVFEAAEKLKKDQAKEKAKRMQRSKKIMMQKEKLSVAQKRAAVNAGNNDQIGKGDYTKVAEDEDGNAGTELADVQVASMPEHASGLLSTLPENFLDEEQSADGKSLLVEDQNDELDEGIVDDNDNIPSLAMDPMFADERSYFPIVKYSLLIFTFVLILVVSLIRGGLHGTPSIIGLEFCSYTSWFYFILPIPIIFGLTFAVSYYLYEKHKKKLALNYKFREGELKWDLRTLTISPIMCFCTGISNSLLGLGTGSIMGPFLLEMGMNTASSTATTSFMVLVSSAVTAVQFFILGKIPWDYGVTYFISGFIGAALGEIIIGYPAHKYGFSFLLIWSISIVIILAIFLMGGEGVYSIYTDLRQQAYMGFKSPCI